MFYIIVSICFCVFCQLFLKRLTKIVFFRVKNEFFPNLLDIAIKTKNAPNFFEALYIVNCKYLNCKCLRCSYHHKH